MGGTNFDKLQDAAFDTVLNTMGYEAAWTPSPLSSPTQNAKVLFKDPTQMHRLNGPYGDQMKVEYDPFSYIIEYKKGDFIELISNVRNGLEEIVSIDAVEYYVSKVEAKWDGKTFIATLGLKE